jgi:hypothetical protein
MAKSTKLGTPGGVAVRLRQRSADRQAEAGATWRQLAAEVAGGGELTSEQLETLEDAADLLAISDPAEAFAADCEALRMLVDLDRQLAAFDRASHPARVVAARERLKSAEAELASARGALNRLRHESEAARHVSIARQKLLEQHRRVLSTGGN